MLISLSFHRKPLWGESVEVKVWEEEENSVWERERDSHEIFLIKFFFFSKSASSNSYFGLKSLPALRDNGTVLSVLNTNYHYIYCCIRGFLCFSDSSSRTSHETLRNLQRRTLHWLKTQAWHIFTTYLKSITCTICIPIDHYKMQNNIKTVESILCAECNNIYGHRILHIIKQISEAKQTYRSHQDKIYSNF